MGEASANEGHVRVLGGISENGEILGLGTFHAGIISIIKLVHGI